MVKNRVNEKIVAKSRELYGRRHINIVEKTRVLYYVVPVLVVGMWRMVNAKIKLRKCVLGNYVTLRGSPRIEGKGKIIIGTYVRIWAHMGVTQLYAAKNAILKIGDNSFINTDTIISASKRIMIGDNVQIANQVILMDGDFHGVEDRNSDGKAEGITIEDDVWIATRAMVLKGVRIGKGSTVAAGAVVTKDIPEYTLVAGVPAKEIRKLKRPKLMAEEKPVV